MKMENSPYVCKILPLNSWIYLVSCLIDSSCMISRLNDVINTAFSSCEVFLCKLFSKLFIINVPSGTVVVTHSD